MNRPTSCPSLVIYRQRNIVSLVLLKLVCLLACLLAEAGNATASTRYVNLNNPSPVLPFTNWTTAATNIQDAVDASVAGDEIVVTNGVYDTGARQVYGMSNRVAVTTPVIVRSVNGPGVTTIRGYQVPGTITGEAAVRCVYLTHSATLVGFTLTQGATKTSGSAFTDQSGGGVWCEGGSAVISNCVLTGNSAYFLGGGGAYSGTLNNCTLTGNSAYTAGGAYLSTLNDCTLTGNSASAGAGAVGCTLNNCVISGNVGQYYGGGADNSGLNNCVIKGNYGMFGGGVNASTLNNCVVTDNYAWPNGFGGGAHNSTLNNCIVYHNRTGGTGENYYNCTLNYCCTTPLPGGLGNFTNAPLLVDTFWFDNLRLLSNSPCINSGNNAYATATSDLDGNPRIVGGTVDVGAYEYRSPYQVWLQQYGLPTDGSVDQSDSDGDSHRTWQEWIAGTNPTNAASVLRLLTLNNNASGIAVTWSSVSNRTYSLERATNMGASPAFGLVRSNLTGLSGSTSFTDTNATSAIKLFYRVRVGQ